MSERLVKLGYITFSSRQEAEDLCVKLVQEKMIACANIFSEHQAVYSWEDKTVQETEVGVLIKTESTQEKRILAFLKQHHSYSEPACVFWEVSGGAKTFLKWIQNQLI